MEKDFIDFLIENPQEIPAALDEVRKKYGSHEAGRLQAAIDTRKRLYEKPDTKGIVEMIIISVLKHWGRWKLLGKMCATLRKSSIKAHRTLSATPTYRLNRLSDTVSWNAESKENKVIRVGLPIRIAYPVIS